MRYASYNVISDRSAAQQIINAQGAYLGFWGAGLSAEALVPNANQICELIAKDQLSFVGFSDDVSLDQPDVRDWLTLNLSWDRLDKRYAECIRAKCPSPGDRVEFFRNILAGSRPSFAHYGAALLMNQRILARTCLTTNFDKLLEQAFIEQGLRECQPLRNANEIRYWVSDQERCFCLKLHGDYDTHNVLNTVEETVRIDEKLRSIASRIIQNSGLLVLGLAGYETSVYSFFDDLTEEASMKNGAFSRGLLWGVFVGPKPYEPWDSQKMENAVRKAVDSGVVAPKIKDMMTRMASSPVQFAFFPVFGSGQFMMDLIETSRSRSLIGQAEPFLDREMRLRRVFGDRANLSPDRIDEHIRKLNEPKPKFTGGQSPRVERAFEVKLNERQLWLAYGDIASRSYLGHKDFVGKIRAVVSSDDTFLSVGGGVAVALAKKAGLRTTLHEVSKFVSVPHGESRVTSAGALPVHYIIHAATIEVCNEGYKVTEEDVRKTFRDVLTKAVALGVDVLSVPLLGAGVAGLSAEDSFRGLLQGYNDLLLTSGAPATVVFVVYQESQLARARAKEMIEQIICSGNCSWSEEPWPVRTRTRASI